MCIRDRYNSLIPPRIIRAAAPFPTTLSAIEAPLKMCIRDSSYYYHYALLSVGGELMAAFETSLAPVSLSPIIMEAVFLGADQQQITTFPVSYTHLPCLHKYLFLFPVYHGASLPWCCFHGRDHP